MHPLKLQTLLQFLLLTSVAQAGIFDWAKDIWDSAREIFVPSLGSLPFGPKITLPSKEVIVGNYEILSGLESYLGIPFAAPPVGDLRFRHPKPYAGSLNGFHAKAFGPSCPQMNPVASYTDTLPKVALDLVMQSPLYQVFSPSGEDCLTLNIYRPRGLAPTAKLPVMFWIFGGGFELGGSNIYLPQQLMGQAKLMGKDFIYVSHNYRTSGFGFLGGKEIKAEGSGNAGLLDQRRAMEWVADNIAAFGGDPDKVTIFGESSGSISCSHHMIGNNGDNTYKGKPLFRAVIMQSGTYLPVKDIDAPFPQHIFNTVSNAAGCGSATDKLGCMRKVSYSKLLAATNMVPSIASYFSLQLSYMPRPDGNYIKYNGRQMFLDGKYAKVPYIIGDQEDEGTIFAITNLNLTTDNHSRDYLKNVFSSITDPIIDGLFELYLRSGPEGSPFGSGYANILTSQNKRVAALLGDAVFHAPRRFMLQNTPAVRKYTFQSQQLRGLPIVGTFHGNDVVWQYFVLGSGSLIYRNAFICFANNLDPNSGGIWTLTKWPEYTNNPTANNMMYINTLTISTGRDDFRVKPLAYWNEHYDQLLA